MRIRKKKWAQPELDVCNFFVKEPEKNIGAWNSLFAKKQPLYLEVGCGKGGFIANLALENKDKNYLAVDIKSDMLGVARRNITEIFENAESEVENILLIAKNVDKIDEIISPEDNIEGMYINFCNPWPKKKHKKRRLTHPTKLELYKKFLKKGANIYFKTDDDELFDESLEYFKECGFEITYITYDLHNSDVEGNIMTEHEKMFSQEGIKIKYLVAKFV